MIVSHLPALQVVVPLMAAPICVIIRRQEWVWGLAVLITWVSAIIAILLLQAVQAGGPIVYHLGGWAPPIGIEYRIDIVSAYVLLIVAVIGIAAITYARPSVIKEVPGDRIYLFYTCFLLCFTGLLGMTVTGDAFNLFVFLEISSLSSYVLISLGRDRRALTAALRYLILGTIGATMYVIGLGLLYMMTGTLNMADLAQRLPAVADTRTIQVALAFLTVGLSLKLALFPLHLWLPNAYTYAPSVVTAFLSATATKVAVYVLLRFFFTIFGQVDPQPLSGGVEVIVEIMAIIGMLAASLTAIFQSDVKRMLAYSSVAQIGYIMLGVSFASQTGLTAGIVHLFNHALMKTALFMAVGCVIWRVGSCHIRSFDGLARHMPLTFAALVAAGLSLIGVPVTVGFISKWQLMLASFEADQWPVAILIALSSVLAVIYVWRLIEAGFFRPVPAHLPPRQGLEAPLGMLIPMLMTAAASIYFGLDTNLTLGIAHEAASSLLGS